MREDGFVEVDQREARYLDVLLLRERQQQVKEFTLHFQNFDHLQHATAGGVNRTRPRPGARIALIADLRHLGQIDGADEIGNVRSRRIMRCVGTDADARGLGQKHALDGHTYEVALELTLDEIARPRRQLALDVDPVATAKLRPQAGWNQVERVLAQRRATDRIDGAFLGTAVFLQTTLEEDRERRLAPGRRTEQQEQPAADVGACSCRLEVVDDARQGLIDAKQLALEELAGARIHRCIGLHRAAVPLQHVPDVLVARARKGCGICGQDIGEKLAESPLPSLRAMQTAERTQRVDEIGSAALGILVNAGHRPSLPLNSYVRTQRWRRYVPRQPYVSKLVPTLRRMSDGLSDPVATFTLRRSQQQIVHLCESGCHCRYYSPARALHRCFILTS